MSVAVLFGLLVALSPLSPDMGAEARDVLAEGRAAIGSSNTGGVLAAKQAAVALAMRNALEKTVGVYVAGTTLTHNYQLVKDEVLTHADGFVTLKEIVRTEQPGDGTVRVVIRAVVSVRPLAERLKALRLTRAYRIYIESPKDAVPTETAASVLIDAGFFVTENRADADVTVRVSPVFHRTADTPLDTAAGAMTMHSVRAEVSLVATRVQTGEVVATLHNADTGANISASVARTEAASGALTTLAPRLADALLTLPAQSVEPVEVVVTGVTGATGAAALGEAITVAVPGVEKETRRSLAGGRVVYEFDVLAAAQPLFARALETAPALSAYHLRVMKETRNRIVATGVFQLSRSSETPRR